MTPNTYNLIIYTFRNGSNWFSPCTLSLPNEDACFPVIEIDSQNRVHAVWRQFFRLYYRSCEGNSWSIPESIPGSDTAFFPFVICDDSLLHLVWQAKGTPIRGIWYTREELLGIEETSLASIEFIVEPLLPNPFSKEIKVCYRLPESSYVIVTFSDISGRVINGFDLGYNYSGKHEFVLTKDRIKKGGVVCGGVYFLTLKAGSCTVTRKFTLIH